MLLPFCFISSCELETCHCQTYELHICHSNSGINCKTAHSLGGCFVYLGNILVVVIPRSGTCTTAWGARASARSHWGKSRPQGAASDIACHTGLRWQTPASTVTQGTRYCQHCHSRHQVLPALPLQAPGTASTATPGIRYC